MKSALAIGIALGGTLALGGMTAGYARDDKSDRIDEEHDTARDRLYRQHTADTFHDRPGPSTDALQRADEAANARHERFHDRQDAQYDKIRGQRDKQHGERQARYKIHDRPGLSGNASERAEEALDAQHERFHDRQDDHYDKILEDFEEKHQRKRQASEMSEGKWQAKLGRTHRNGKILRHHPGHR